MTARQLYYREEGGQRLPITNMYDVDGEHTDDPQEAAVLIVRTADLEYRVMRIAGPDNIVGSGQ